ncbi:TIGR02221 family CRISPR-associated protein [Schnuerera sp. xch1]|uniref:CRISPR-associated protein Csx20 n=1 Tax=Schnuerera sp. xch1 TaxID=2874283 RepID=UPI001CBFBAD4|nr:CRISPR-associated protein Csx20 [Schnuerera sp. xch1]MBZ2175789.1 TIGR02221 family CRISPR-associated protein [Schnuerera sp. xch1]
MSKKIISFLGNGNYKKTKYGFTDQNGMKKVVETSFIQEAISSLVGKDAELYIGLTGGEKGSRKTNWESGNKEIIDWNTCEKKTVYQAGLKEILDNRRIKYRDFELRAGANEEEIWENFDIVFNLLDYEDEVYIDITHSFRSLPIIIMSIINYAKFIKNISIEGIYYGAFDAKDKDGIAPIFDLSLFNAISDWTIGAEKFINSGDARLLVSHVKKAIDNYKSIIRRSDEEADSLRSINKALENFVGGVYTVRGHMISEYGCKLKDELDNFRVVNINELKPFGEILDKIYDKVYFYSGNILKDIHYTVKLCNDLNLVQQAYTFIQENIVNFICLSSNIPLNDANVRIHISGLIMSKYDNYFKGSPYVEKLVIRKEIDCLLTKDLTYLYKEIGDLRNDLNHAGFRRNASKPDKFKKKLDKFIQRFEKVIDMDTLTLKKSNTDYKPSSKMILIFSHKLTDKQIQDAKENLNIQEFIYLPDNLQNEWSSIPPYVDNLNSILDDIKDWIDNISQEDDYVLVQGEYGAIYKMVEYCKEIGLKPIYSTTKRQVKEVIRDDGKIEITHVFDHVRFRRY